MNNFLNFSTQKKQPMMPAVQHTRENVRPTESAPIALNDSRPQLSMATMAIKRKMTQIRELTERLTTRWTNENDDRVFKLIEQLTLIAFSLGELQNELTLANAADMLARLNSDPQFNFGSEFAAFGE